MSKRLFDYLTSAVTAVSILFLIFYFLATDTTLFTPQGSYLNQGYVGKNANINLYNIAVGVFIALIVSVLLNRFLVSKQSKGTRFIRKAGIAVIIMVGIWLLVVIVSIAYLLLSGKFLQNWQF
jgi:multisubunit Na+/H+ antiporter MnhE subunit